MPADQREEKSGEAEEWGIHSFIVKIWRDATGGNAAAVGWRGRITHVPSSERRYLRSLEEIPDFILPYLREMGVKLQWRWRLRHWMRGPRRSEGRGSDRDIRDGN